MSLQEGEDTMSEEQDPYVALLKRQIKRTDILSENHLMCRRGALGHAWAPVEPDFDVKVRGATAVAFQCQRCYAIKRGTVSNRYGEWLSPPHFEYPEGYLIPKEPDEIGPTVSAQAVRAAFVKRVQSNAEALLPMVLLHEAPVDD